MKKIEYNEDVFVIEEFLSNQECKNLIAIAEEIGFEEAKVQVEKGVETLMKSIRNNERILYKNEQLAFELFEKSKDFLVKETENGTLLNLNEMFRFYKYNQGQRFKMHRDGNYVRNECEISYYTFMIYLNDNYEGGETEFQNLFSIIPKQGDLLVFHHPIKHEGKALISDIKYVLRSDVMYKLNRN